MKKKGKYITQIIINQDDKKYTKIMTEIIGKKGILLSYVVDYQPPIPFKIPN